MSSDHSTSNYQPQPDDFGLELSDSSPESESESNTGEERNKAENEEKINQLDADLLRNQQNADKSFGRNIAGLLATEQQTITNINSASSSKAQVGKAPEAVLAKSEVLFFPHAVSIGFGRCRWPPCEEPGTSLAWCKKCNWAYIGCQEHCKKRNKGYECPIGHKNTEKGPVRIPLSFSNFIELMEIRNESD